MARATALSAPAVVSERLMLPMRDGVRLHTLVTRPASGRHAVMLVRNPYGVAAGGDGVLSWVHAGSRAGLVASGWAVVEQDTRGRFESEGDDLPFVADIDDAYDTLEWCAAQPWSTGRVAMGCASGLGATQHMAALSGHPALVAISPTVGPGDPRTGWVMEGGALQWAFCLHWAAQQGVNGGHLDGEGLRVHRDVLETVDRARRELPATVALRRHSRFFDAWVRDDPAYWAPLRSALRRPPAPVAGFHTTGWYDVFAEGALRGYRRLLRGGARQRLVVGPWSHSSMYARQVGEVDFGDLAARPQTKDEMHAFLQAAAAGATPAGGASVFLMGADRWVELPTWPPRARPIRLWPARGGRLGDTAPSGGGADRFAYDPEHPVPTHGGRALVLAEGPHDQREIEERDDVLVYTGAPLQQELTVMGTVRATLEVSSTARSADVAVALVDVHPDGRALGVIDSVRRVVLRPGERRRLRVELGSTAMTFRAGHRVRIHVCASNFPRLDRNASTGEPPARAQRLLPATHVLHLGASQVTLPSARVGC